MCESKQCTKCGNTKPLSEYGTYRRYDRVCHESYCRECKRAKDRAFGKTERGREINRLSVSKYHNSEKAKQKRIEQWFADNQGAICGFQIHHCKGCGMMRRYRNDEQPPKSGYLKCCKHLHRWECEHKEVKCRTCGVLFIGKFANSMCNECVRKSVRAVKNRMRREYATHMSRARKHGVVCEKVRRSVVYKRDNYACYACGCSVVDCKEYRPDQATLDHVIPMAKGGPHTYANVKTMCMRCNTRKWNYDPEYIIPMLKEGTWKPSDKR